MRILSALLLCLGLSAAAAETGPAFALHDGDRVVFYGDSITQDGAYARLVEAYARNRFPSWDLRFYNSGVGGDTVLGGGAGEIGVRLERDVIRLKPTVVTIMLGMNDGRYRPLEPATLAAFSDGYRALVQKLKAALPGVRLYLIQPSPFDDFSRPPDFDPGYDQVLRRLGEAVATISRDEHAALVDFGGVVERGIRSVGRDNGDLARQLLPDRVHPNPAVHLVMGAALLRAWHAPALVARVEIDAKSAKVLSSENAEVTALTVEVGKLTWNEFDRALPLPLNFADADVDLAQKAGADLESLDAQTLVIAGLRDGRYEVRIDDQVVGVFPATALAAGLNLARYNTPMRWQAYRVRWNAEHGHEVQRIERGLAVAQAEDPGLAAAAASLAAREEFEQAGRSRPAQPQVRKFSVAPVP